MGWPFLTGKSIVWYCWGWSKWQWKPVNNAKNLHSWFNSQLTDFDRCSYVPQEFSYSRRAIKWKEKIYLAIQLKCDLGKSYNDTFNRPQQWRSVIETLSVGEPWYFECCLSFGLLNQTPPLPGRFQEGIIRLSGLDFSHIGCSYASARLRQLTRSESVLKTRR